MRRDITLFLLLFFASRQLLAEESIFDRASHLLSTRCLSCHNQADRQGDLSLQTKGDVLESGFVEPFDPTASVLLDMISPSDDSPPQMPKEGAPLTAEELQVVRTWITNGADWPEGYQIEEPAVDDFDWWSFQPLRRPAVPRFDVGATADAWGRNPIDTFIWQRLLTNGLTPSPEADRRTLIRRLTFDLIGLPPTPHEVQAFLDDPGPLAYERLVDRLLASPRYGERWGRHWLDVVKYADTCGYDKDKLRPQAWPYRDYVIRSFNNDKPFSQFVQEQLAGDVLFPGKSDGILGLGFIAAGPWDFIGHVEVPESKIDGRVARHLDRDEMVSNTLNTFCSLTIQCARCHNHKFDPFRQEDYYSLQAIFAAVDRAERPYDLDPQVERRRQQLEQQLSESQTEQTELEGQIRKEGGPELSRLMAQIQELEPKTAPRDNQAEFGYHSVIVDRPDIEKWVEVDLGQDQPIGAISLHACHDEFNKIGAGFGFPVQFHVTLRSGAGEAETIYRTDDSFPNPGLEPFVVAVAGRKARYVRVVATQLAERQSDFILALSELAVMAPDGRNVAHGAAVTALDSIEAPVRWRRTNLTDGIWPEPIDREASQALQRARFELADILARVRTPQREDHLAKLAARVKVFQTQLDQLPEGKMVYAAATYFRKQANFTPTNGKPRTIHVLHRGNIQQPLAAAAPDVPSLTADGRRTFLLEEQSDETQRRAALANWITRHDHPLTWRSIVNRVWLNHFGRGIVSTPNDFGRMGQQPTHPELLDWLACEFRDGSQSIKHLHRLIVTSATYRQTSRHNAQQAAIDGNNRFMWRMNRRRLTAEEIRDTVLKVSDRLDTSMGGPGYYLFVLEKPEHSPHFEYHKFDPSDARSHRRSVYRFVVRSQPDPYMTTLDCADSSQSTPQRHETVTALQALSLLNNRFQLYLAEQFALQLELSHTRLERQVENAVWLALARRLDDSELQELNHYARQHGLSNLCRVLFNLSEFVYVD
jgi:hypothetical protein